MIILGGAGHAREVLDILQVSKNDGVYFYDDINENIPDKIFGVEVLKSEKQAIDILSSDSRVIIGTGNVKTRRLLAEKFQALGASIFTVIANSAIVSKNNCTIGSGVNIMNQAFISNNVIIGAGSLINAKANIHHDVNIGEYCEIGPAVLVSGNVIVGKNTFIGAGAVILPGIVIGENCTIGAGAVVTKNVTDGLKVKRHSCRLMNDKKLISVCMITYNHAKYVSQALDGILMQESDANIEIIIGDDFSQDSTIEIIKKYQAKYPDIIRFIQRDRNIGMMKNFIEVLKQCNGDFVAICEGDDYWVDPLKIKKQIDLLSQNENCIICFTDLKVLDDSNGERLEPYYNYHVQEKYSITDIFNSNPMVTCTVVFKNVLDENILNDLAHFKIGDWPLYFLAMQKSSGMAIFLNWPTSVYRRHEQGGYSTLNNLKRLYINLDVYQQLLKLKKFNKHKGRLTKNISKTAYAIAIRSTNDIEKKSMLRQSILHIGLTNINYPVKGLIKFCHFSLLNGN